MTTRRAVPHETAGPHLRRRRYTARPCSGSGSLLRSASRASDTSGLASPDLVVLRDGDHHPGLVRDGPHGSAGAAHRLRLAAVPGHSPPRPCSGCWATGWARCAIARRAIYATLAARLLAFTTCSGGLGVPGGGAQRDLPPQRPGDAELAHRRDHPGRRAHGAGRHGAPPWTRRGSAARSAGAGLSTFLGLPATYLFVTFFYLAGLALTLGVALAAAGRGPSAAARGGSPGRPALARAGPLFALGLVRTGSPTR